MPGPTPMYRDSEGAIQIAKYKAFHEQAEHIEIECHVVFFRLKEHMQC